MTFIIFLSRKNNFLRLFCYIRIKQHFPLVGPMCYFNIKSSLRFDSDIARLVIVEKSEVSSAKSFALQHEPCGKSLI